MDETVSVERSLRPSARRENSDPPSGLVPSWRKETWTVASPSSQH